jgi:hypothetical protein
MLAGIEQAVEEDSDAVVTVFTTELVIDFWVAWKRRFWVYIRCATCSAAQSG